MHEGRSSYGCYFSLHGLVSSWKAVSLGKPSLEIPAFVKLKGHLISLNGNLAAHSGAGCSEVVDVYVDLLIFQKFVYSNS